MKEEKKVKFKKQKQFNPYNIFEINNKHLFKSKLLHKNFLSSSSLINDTIYLPQKISKKMKQITVSNDKYKNYISSYDKITKENCFKTPNNTLYPKRKNIHYASISYLVKRKNENNIKIKKNLFDNLKLKKKYLNITNSFNNTNNETTSKNCYDDNINKEANIEETPYGFKYKDTKIVIDFNKYKNNHSSKVKSSKNNYFKNFGFNYYKNQDKETQTKNNNFFINFSDGNFFENNKRKNMTNFNKYKPIIKDINGKNNEENYDDFKPYDLQYNNNENKEYNIKKEKNISFLFDIIKNIQNYINDININDKYKKHTEYNIKSQFKNNLKFLLKIKSICLEFTEINSKDNLNSLQKQKIYLPIYYLPLFYLLDFTTFKCFLSEIITYDNTNNKFLIKQDNEIAIINKYGEIAEMYYKNYLRIKEKNNLKIFNDITYDLNEYKYQLNYDWCIYNKTGDVYNKKIYKMRIIFPTAKFSLKQEKIKLYKYICKNLMIELFKKKFNNWNKYVLFDLFILKKFRLIINNILSDKYYLYENKKIYLDKNYNEINRNISNYNNNKYEFFITNANVDKTNYFYFMPDTVILTYLLDPQILKANFILLSINDMNNINKLSKCFGIYDIITKCLYTNKKNNEVSLNMSLIDNISDDYIKIVEKENYIKNMNIENDYKENEIFCYKYNDLDINILLRKSKIININFTKNKIELFYYDIPELLKEDILKNNNNNHIESLFKCMDEIIINCENNINNFNKENIYINKGEIAPKNNFTKLLMRRPTKVNKEHSIIIGKLNKKIKMAKNYSKLLSKSNKNIKFSKRKNILDNNNQNNLLNYNINIKRNSLMNYSFK